MGNKPEIEIWKSAHNTLDCVIYDMPNTKLVDFISLLDIWGSKGYDRFQDGGLYFEIPSFLYDIIDKLPFINRYHITVTKR